MRALALLPWLLAAALAQVQVAATTPILADLVRQVGGNRVAAVAVVPPGADPHTFEPTPSVAQALSQTRLLFANGLGLGPYLPKLQALLPQNARVVLLGEGQPDLICGEDHAEEDHGHGPCDPHLWLDPAYAVRYAERILEALAALDPGGRDLYRANLERFKKEVEALDRAYRACGLKGTKVVVQHDAFRYFARRYGLEVVGVLSQGGAQEVGSRSFLALLEKAKREGSGSSSPSPSSRARP